MDHLKVDATRPTNTAASVAAAPMPTSWGVSRPHMPVGSDCLPLRFRRRVPVAALVALPDGVSAFFTSQLLLLALSTNPVDLRLVCQLQEHISAAQFTHPWM